MDRVRLGVIGLGNMGTAHIRDNVPKVPRLELTAVCDVDPARADRFEDVAKFTDASEMIRSGLIDAVLIATPHYFHTSDGIAALEAGLHVLVEKPISVHKADCERLISAAKPDRIFAAMFNQRTDPAYRTIKKLVQDGELGEIRRLNWIITNWFRTEAYYKSGGWRATWAGEGGGVLMNQCPHNLDLFQWMFGMPSSVRAFAGYGKYHDIEVEDEVTAYLEYPNGATGVFITSTGEYPGTNRLEVVADRGRLVYDGGKLTFDRTTVSVPEFRSTSPDMFASMPTWKVEVPTGSGSGGQHLEIMRNFVDAILDGKELIAPASEGVHSVELANAMILSSQTGETIPLPMDSARFAGKLDELRATSRGKTGVTDKVADTMSGTYGSA